MAEGKVEAACPKFADSNKLDPASGTLLNLGSCFEKLGRTASAWAAFREAVSRAQSAGRADHLRIAEAHATSLQATLARVTVTVDNPVPGIEIRRDGVPVTDGEWGLPIPVDPGPHTYVAQAPQHASWTTHVNVVVDAAVEVPPVLTVTIPALTPLPPPPDASVHRGPETPVASSGFWQPRRIVAAAVGAGGLVGLGVGTALAVSAKAAYNSSLTSCPVDKNRCTPAGVSERDDARTQGNIATAAFLIGTAALATGVVLWVTAPSEPSSTTMGSLQVSPSVGGMTMSGRW